MGHGRFRAVLDQLLYGSDLAAGLKMLPLLSSC